jgi:hypothetical protein
MLTVSNAVAVGQTGSSACSSALEACISMQKVHNAASARVSPRCRRHGAARRRKALLNAPTRHQRLHHRTPQWAPVTTGGAPAVHTVAAAQVNDCRERRRETRTGRQRGLRASDAVAVVEMSRNVVSDARTAGVRKRCHVCRIVRANGMLHCPCRPSPPRRRRRRSAPRPCETRRKARLCLRRPLGRQPAEQAEWRRCSV